MQNDNYNQWKGENCREAGLLNMASVTGFMAGGIFGLFVGVFVASAIFAERKDKK